MKLFNIDNINSIFDAVASYNGITSDELRAEINNIINYAWHSEDLKIKAHQNNLFPAGKPTPEEFIQTIAIYLKQN